MSRPEGAPPKGLLFLQAAYVPKKQKVALYSAPLQMYVGYGSVSPLGDVPLYWEQVYCATKNVETSSLLRNTEFLNASAWTKDKPGNITMYHGFVTYMKMKYDHATVLGLPNYDAFCKKFPERVNQKGDWECKTIETSGYDYKKWLQNDPRNWSRLSETGRKALLDAGYSKLVAALSDQKLDDLFGGEEEGEKEEGEKEEGEKEMGQKGGTKGKRKKRTSGKKRGKRKKRVR